MSAHRPHIASIHELRGIFAGFRVVLALAIAISIVSFSTDVRAQDVGNPTREAAKHFQRGVALYGEADYRAALVEFRRAYALAPNAAVLYNVGETEFQLQDYAAALTTFDRYLADAPLSDSHRGDVDSSVQVLRARVGHLTITTVPASVDIAIDDQFVGKTPLERPVLVSIGHRKIVASTPGRPSITRYVDVATDDNLPVNLQLPPFPELAWSPLIRSFPNDEPHGAGAGPVLRVAGWVGTAALAGGAVTFGLLADKESSDLQRTRGTFPLESGTLTHMARLTSTYSMVADSFTVAAVILGGITLYSTILSFSAGPRVRGATQTLRIAVGPASAQFNMTF